MFSASGENTQIALSNIVCLSVRAPSATTRLRQELDDAYAARGPTYEMVKYLPDLRAYVDEAIGL